MNRLRISGEKSPNLPEGFHIFPQSLQAHAGTVLHLSYNRFFKKQTFQVITRPQSY